MIQRRTAPLSLALLAALLLPASLPAQTAEPIPYDELVEQFDQFWENRTPRKGEGYKQFRRIQHFTELREDREGRFNPWAIRDAWLELQQRRSGLDELDNESDWTPLGPFHPYPGSYVGGMGRINAIAFHPSSDSIFYVGAGSGGLWKTVDAGASWLPLTDQLPVLGVSDIVVHPHYPDTLWLATGDRDAFHRRIPTYTIGVMKSTDGGESWSETGLNYTLPDQQVVTRLAMHPAHPDTLLAATTLGIWRTADGGTTWSEVHAGGQVYDIEPSPVDPSVWLAAIAGQGVFRSTDSGQSFTEVTAGLPPSGFTRIETAFAPSDPTRVYALYADDTLPFYNPLEGVYRSDDGGQSWTLTADSPNILGWNEAGSDNRGQGWFALTLEVNPSNPDEVWSGSVNVWRSTDGGTNWTCETYWSTYSDLPYIHADHHILKYRDNVLFSGNDGGIYRKNTTDDQWVDLSNLLVISQIYRLGTYQGSPEVSVVLNGNQDNGTKQYDAGIGWVPVLGGDGFDCGVDPLTDQVRYGSIYYGDFRRSTDGGESWEWANSGIQEEGAWLTPFVVDTTTPGRLFRGHKRVYRSDDRGLTWQGSAQLTNDFIRALAVAPSDPDVVYAVDWMYQLFRSEDGGETFSSHYVPVQKMTYIAVHPEHADSLYATAGLFYEGQKVLVSGDGGVNWTSISEGLPNVPFNTITVDVDRPSHLYAGCDLGVWFSGDGGASWIPYDGGLPNVIVTELEIHRNSGTLLASTFGRGTWQSPIQGDAEEVEEAPARITDWSLAPVWPNPFNEQARVRIHLPRSAPLRVALFNLTGRQVRTLHEGRAQAGVLELDLNAAGLASGLYFVRATSPGELDATRRVALIR